MKAHKVPATYYSAWNISGMKHSFYVFYKFDINAKGQIKRYRKINSITQEHSYFMEEDFYYLDINKTPGLVYKLKNEIDEFFLQRKYDIKCVDILDEDSTQNHQIIDIVNYDNYMYCRSLIDSWIIKDCEGNIRCVDAFKRELSEFIFNKIGTIIEEDYFSKQLEQKWPMILREICKERTAGDKVNLSCLQDFLEFFVIQYIRVDDIIVDEIKPTVDLFKSAFATMGFTDDELKNIEADGMLDADSYFYAALLDAARGNKTRLNRKIKMLEENYVIDILHSPLSTGFITTTSPCVVAEMVGKFKSLMIFPVSPQYCIRFVGKSKEKERYGKYFELSTDEVKAINRIIISKSRNIVMSEMDELTGRI